VILQDCYCLVGSFRETGVPIAQVISKKFVVAGIILEDLLIPDFTSSTQI